MSVAAVILAAGASTRMGRPKALIEWNGRPFVDHCVGHALAAGCMPIVVVEGAVRLEESVAPAATLVRNGEWERGPLSSLQQGLGPVIGGTVRGVLVMTVDRPHVETAVLAALIAAFEVESECIWQPSHSGRNGHPILYPIDDAVALRALPPTASARDHLRDPDVAARRRSLAVADGAVLENLDTPEDLRRILGL